MADYGISIGYKKSWLDNAEVTSDRISSYNPSYNGEDVVNSIYVDNSSYTGNYTTTAASSDMRDTAITYSNNALLYLYDIRPIAKPLLQYAMPKKKKLEYAPIENLKGYTSDPTQTKEYEDINKNLKLLDSMMKTNQLSKGQALVTALYNLFKSIGLSSKNVYKLEDDNTIKESDSLEDKLRKYYANKKSSGDSFLDKLTDFLDDNGLKLNTNFKILPQILPLATNVIQDTDIYKNMELETRNKIGEDKQTISSLEYNINVDTYDYMAGGKMYSSFRDPLVIGQKPKSTLETETSVFGGTQLLEKRFDLLNGLLEPDYKQKDGEALWKAIDIKNKAEYIAKSVQYNLSVLEINKTNEMLTIFADKLELLALANMFVNMENPDGAYALFYGGSLTGGRYYTYKNHLRDMIETVRPYINGVTTTSEMQNILVNKTISASDYYGTYSWKVTNYVEYYNHATYPSSYNAAFNAAANKILGELDEIVSETQDYQDELATWAAYMDSTYGIEV